jgi:hypothetical protein
VILSRFRAVTTMSVLLLIAHWNMYCPNAIDRYEFASLYVEEKPPLVPVGYELELFYARESLY